MTANILSQVLRQSEQYKFTAETINESASLRLQLEHYSLDNFRKYQSTIKFNDMHQSIKFWFDSLDDLIAHLKNPINYQVIPELGLIKVQKFMIGGGLGSLGSAVIKLKEVEIGESQKIHKIIKYLGLTLMRQRKQFEKFKQRTIQNQKQTCSRIDNLVQQVKGLKQQQKLMQKQINQNKLSNQVPLIKNNQQSLQLFQRLQASKLPITNNRPSIAQRQKSPLNISKRNITLQNRNKSIKSVTKVVKKQVQIFNCFMKCNIHPQFEILDRRTITSINKSQKLAVIKIENSQKRSKYSMRFIIRKLGEWMGFGICNIKTIEQNKYKFQFDKIHKHGTFMMTSQGRTWSNIQDYYKLQTEFPKFKKCQVITVTADYDRQRVIFQREAVQYEMPFNGISRSQLGFCVYIYDKKGSVRIG